MPASRIDDHRPSPFPGWRPRSVERRHRYLCRRRYVRRSPTPSRRVAPRSTTNHPTDLQGRLRPGRAAPEPRSPDRRAGAHDAARQWPAPSSTSWPTRASSLLSGQRQQGDQSSGKVAPERAEADKVTMASRGHAVTNLERQLVDDGVDQERCADPADDQSDAEEQVDQLRRRVESLGQSSPPRLEVIERSNATARSRRAAARHDRSAESQRRPTVQGARPSPQPARRALREAGYLCGSNDRLDIGTPYGAGASTLVTAETDPVPVAGRPVVVIVTETVTRLPSIDSAAREPVSPLTANRRAIVEITADRAATGSTTDSPARAESASRA